MNTTNLAQNANVYVYRLRSSFAQHVLNVVLARRKSLLMVGFWGWTFRCLPIHIFLGIELRTPAWRKLLVARQYQIQFSVDDTPRLTKQAKEKKNCVSWNENLYL